MNDLDLTSLLSKKYQQYPRRRGRYNSSELYAITHKLVSPSQWMHPPQRSPKDMMKMYMGTVLHDHIQRLLPAEGNEVKREYYHDGIILVAKADHLPAHEDAVWEFKTSEDEKEADGAKDWARYQAKIYCTIFQRSKTKIFQPVQTEKGFFLKHIGEEERDDEWFEKQMDKLFQFHLEVEKYWNTLTEIKKEN